MVAIDNPCILVLSRPERKHTVNDVDLRDDNDPADVNDLEPTNNSDTERVSEDTVKVDLYVANAGKGERTGGPYLDDVERHNAETWRAQREGREPDYDNPPATAGTVLVPKSQLLERDTDKMHYSDNVEVTNKPYTTVEVQTTPAEADPAQPNFDNDYDRLKAFEAKKRLDEVGGDDKVGSPNYTPDPVAEHDNTESKRTDSYTDSNLDNNPDDENNSEDSSDWDDTVNPSKTGDSVNH